MELVCAVYGTLISKDDYEAVQIVPRLQLKIHLKSNLEVQLYSTGLAFVRGKCTEDDACTAMAELGITVQEWHSHFKSYGWTRPGSLQSPQELVVWGERGACFIDQYGSVCIGYVYNADEAAKLFEEHVYTKYPEFDKEFRRRIMVPRCLAIRKKVDDLVLSRVYGFL